MHAAGHRGIGTYGVGTIADMVQRMITKQVAYGRTRFSVETLQAAKRVLTEVVVPLYRAQMFENAAARAARKKQDNEFASDSEIDVPSDLIVFDDMAVGVDSENWTFDSADEFLAAIRKRLRTYAVGIKVNSKYRTLPESWNFAYYGGVYVDQTGGTSTVSISLTARALVERVSAVFESALIDDALRDAEPASAKPRVFIGHGGQSVQWSKLKDHLADHHGYDVVAFQSGARTGHTIRDILDEMLDESTFAILVMTAEDEQSDGTMRARQNVVHEAGLFQGRLGFSRAVILLESGTQNFSNLDGIQYIDFGKDNIREAFGDVIATLRREFP